MSNPFTELIFDNACEQEKEGTWSAPLPFPVYGSYLLNGPGRFVVGGKRRGHWLDGDGLARCLIMDGQRVRFISRYVRTPKLEAEAGDTRVFRTFGDAFSGDRLRENVALESPANVSLYPHGSRLLAFGEQSPPFALDPTSLQTMDEFLFENGISPLTPLSAHPKLDPETGRMCNFGARFLGKKAQFLYFEFDPETGVTVQGKSLLDGCYMVHDCAISRRFAFFHLSPYTVDIRRFLKEGSALIDAMDWDPEGETRLLVIDRETGKQAALVPLSRRGFCLHMVGAFELGNRLELAYLEADEPYYDQYYADPGLFHGIGASRLVCLTLDPESWQVVDRRDLDPGYHMDFPTTSAKAVTKAFDAAWMLAMPHEPTGPKFYDRLLRFNPGEGCFDTLFQTERGWYLAGEPALIEHDYGRLLVCQSFHLESGRSRYQLHHADETAAQPVAVFDLPRFDPPAFHTCFLSKN